MRIKHVGIRPLHPLTLVDYKRKIYYEYFPDGSYRVWNERQLNSGCGVETELILTMSGCLYCPACKEYFSDNQWEHV